MSNNEEKSIKVKIIKIVLMSLFVICVFFGIIISNNCKLYFEILSHKFSIPLLLCFIITWLSIFFSCIATYKFLKDINIIDKQACDVLDQKERKSNIKSKIFYHTVIGLFICSILFWGITNNIISQFNFGKKVYIYLCFLAAIYIVTMLLAFRCAIYLILKISSIFNQDFKNYVRIYPLSTPIFEKCYHMFFHGIVLFLIICVLLFILISLLCLNTAAFTDPKSLNKYIIVIAYICILISFILSTIYPYYITKRKIEELKLESISKLKPYTKSYFITVKHIKDSPNNINSNTSIRIYSTLTIALSFIAQIYSLYVLFFS